MKILITRLNITIGTGFQLYKKILKSLVINRNQFPEKT